jgi:type IV pilus assembly protein PilE
MNMKKQSGFTLIELMIGLVIIGILAGVAVPNYLENVKQTKRTDAQAALVQFSQGMERFYSANYTYLAAAVDGDDAGAPAAATFGYTKSPFNGDASYNLSISAVTATSYTLSATPTGSMTSDACGILTLTNTNVKGDGSGGTKTCWR